MSEKKIRKLFVNRSLPVEVAELIDEIYSDNELNNENLSKSGLVGKALLEYKNRKLNRISEIYKTKVLNQEADSIISESAECAESVSIINKHDQSA